MSESRADQFMLVVIRRYALRELRQELDALDASVRYLTTTQRKLELPAGSAADRAIAKAKAAHASAWRETHAEWRAISEWSV